MTSSKPTHTPRLGVNIDHIATLRQARGVGYPCPIQGALICQQAGADGITLHLREDRRHIQDADVHAIAARLSIPVNLEMAATEEMLSIACQVKPAWVCLVPEKRQELTTEGGLDVATQSDTLSTYVAKLQASGIRVSLFIDPEASQIDAAIACGADAIELHTGAYAEASLSTEDKPTEDSRVTDSQQNELQRIHDAVNHARHTCPKLLINAGHGLTRDNVAAIAAITGIHELNIGHALIADAVFMGLGGAVKAMQAAMYNEAE